MVEMIGGGKDVLELDNDIEDEMDVRSGWTCKN
jgi:hypothetical protein